MKPEDQKRIEEVVRLLAAECPIPQPEGANALPGGGWSTNGEPAIWDAPRRLTKAACEAEEPVSHYRCSADPGDCVWHIAEIGPGEAVAVWPAAPTP